MTQPIVLRLVAILIATFVLISALRVVNEMNARVKASIPPKPEICMHMPWHRDCGPYFGVYR